MEGVVCVIVCVVVSGKPARYDLKEPHCFERRRRRREVRRRRRRRRRNRESGDFVSYAAHLHGV